MSIVKNSRYCKEAYLIYILNFEEVSDRERERQTDRQIGRQKFC